jgi:hypothetical protein
VDAGVVGGATTRGNGGCLNPNDSLSKRIFGEHGAFHSVCAGSGGGQLADGVCIALDGDKLKPREDQRKGGNGFGINEDGAGYTLTGVDRHGVAYCADGGEVAATITRQISEQSGQDNRANAVVVSMAQNTRDEVRIVGGDRQVAGALPAEPGMKQQTYVVSTNSNGEDVAPTISSCEYKMGQKQKDVSGGYVITKQEGAKGE